MNNSELMNLKGLVSIRQGDDLIVNNAENKFTNIGLMGILSCIAHQGCGNNSSSYWKLPSYSWSIYIGTNTANITTPTLTALITPIGTAPGTAPTTKTMSNKLGAADGIWEVTWTSTWTAGTVSGVVGEVGLYLQWANQTTFRWTAFGVDVNPPAAMGNRLAVADGEFTQFTLDNTKPLAIDWKIQLSFG